jgi:hypothetical protein
MPGRQTDGRTGCQMAYRQIDKDRLTDKQIVDVWMDVWADEYIDRYRTRQPYG